jgi:hypothetical protein
MDHIRIKWKLQRSSSSSGSAGTGQRSSMVLMGHLDQVEHLDHLWIRSGVSEGQVVLVVGSSGSSGLWVVLDHLRPSGSAGTSGSSGISPSVGIKTCITGTEYLTKNTLSSQLSAGSQHMFFINNY